MTPELLEAMRQRIADLMTLLTSRDDAARRQALERLSA